MVRTQSSKICSSIYYPLIIIKISTAYNDISVLLAVLLLYQRFLKSKRTVGAARVQNYGFCEAKMTALSRQVILDENFGARCSSPRNFHVLPL